VGHPVRQTNNGHLVQIMLPLVELRYLGFSINDTSDISLHN